MATIRGVSALLWNRIVKDSLIFLLVISLLAVLPVGTVSATRGSERPLLALVTNQLAELTYTGTTDFGWSVSISGDWSVVGAPGTNSSRGAAYIFHRDPVSGLLDARALQNPTPGSNERFGWSVAITIDNADPENSTAVVGARDDSSNYKFGGAVYVYKQNQGGNNNWGLFQTLQTTPAIAKGDRFGSAVAVLGDTLVVGAPFEDTDPGAPNRAGSAFIFTRDASGLWSQTGKVTGLEINDRFGTSVAISGATLMVGSPNNTSGGVSKAGTVYFYQRNPTSGIWNLQGNLYATTPATGDLFGKSVAISGNSVVVGAPGSTNATGPAGAVYVFDRIQGTNVWGTPKRLTGPASSLFGNSVAVDGDVVAVGAPNADVPALDQGSVTIFARNEGGVGNWGQSGVLTLGVGANNDLFGSALSLQGNNLLIGAPGRDNHGAAYIYSFHFPLEIDLNGAQANGFDFSSTFTEDGGPVSIVDPANLTINDLSHSNLIQATVTIDNCPDGGLETLTASPSGAISMDWIHFANGVLTIQSPDAGETAPMEDFQAVLRTVQYDNATQNPTLITREISFLAHDAIQDSNQANAWVTINGVNDAPVVTAPLDAIVDEDASLVFNGNISVSDIDAAVSQLAVTTAHGTVTLSGTTGLTFSAGGNGTASMTITGAVADINAAFNGATFLGAANYNGPASITILADDLGNTGLGGPLTDSETVAITVNPVRDSLDLFTFTLQGNQPLMLNTPYTVIFTLHSPAEAPTGLVTITVPGTPATCTGSLNSTGQPAGTSTGSCSLIVPTAGSHSLAAKYEGDANIYGDSRSLLFYFDYLKTYLPAIRR